MGTIRVSGVVATAAMCLSLIPAARSADAAGASTVLKPLGTTNDDCAELTSVTALSATNVWAVGGDGCGTPNAEIQHWDGKRVTRVPIADAWGGYETYFGVAARSPSDIWAVGADSVHTSVALIARWNGQKWTLQQAPAGFNDSYFGEVRIAANGDVWMAGELGNRAALMRIRNGKRTVFRIPNAGRQLNGLYLASATNIWAGGNGFLIHGDGTHWRAVQAPMKVDIQRMAGSGPSDIWAVGWTAATSAVLHYDGNSWRQVNSPAIPEHRGLTGLLVRGPGDVWVTGSTYEGSVTKPLVVHWNGKVWSPIAVTMPASTPNGVINGVAVTKQGVFAVGMVWDNTQSVTIEGPQWWSAAA